jgi:acyl-CoA synthetase (AMP-forming)/AMP-acid ligase II
VQAQYVIDAAEAVSFHDIFERRVRETPHKRALLIDDRAATYLELDRSANRAAAWLNSHGLPAGTHVVISLPISIEAVASVLGILKAGCVIVTNHPAFSEDKLVQQIQSSDSRVLVSESGAVFASAFARTDLRLGLLIGPDAFVADDRITRFHDLGQRYDGFVPTFEPSRARRAAIFHTTGSTFEPKGVVITHGNMIAAFQSITAYLHSTSDDVILHYASFSFDFGIYNTIMPLMFGGSAIAERAIPERAEDILATIQRERVTALHFMPPVVFQLCKAENLDTAPISSVRYLSSTGQVLPAKYIHQLRQAFPNVDLLSMYGMNEATRVLYLPPEESDAGRHRWARQYLVSGPISSMTVAN